MLPPTAAEVGALIASTGKPVHTAYVSHEHPDHWGGVGALGNISLNIHASRGSRKPKTRSDSVVNA